MNSNICVVSNIFNIWIYVCTYVPTCYCTSNANITQLISIVVIEKGKGLRWQSLYQKYIWVHLIVSRDEQKKPKNNYFELEIFTPALFRFLVGWHHIQILVLILEIIHKEIVQVLETPKAYSEILTQNLFFLWPPLWGWYFLLWRQASSFPVTEPNLVKQ